MDKGAKILNLRRSLQFLNKYKILIPKFGFAKTSQQALKIAKKLGYPVAIKIVSPAVTHKTDVDGVHLNLTNERDLKISYEEILKNFKKKFRKAKIDGILVQKMVPNGQEVIIGCKKDNQFGHVIAFGLGGIFTEVFNDVSFKVTPINKNDADDMISEIRGFEILKGYRGKKYDLKSLKEILMKVSNLVCKNPKISEMDINPVIVSNKGAIAVDSRIVLE